MQLFDRGEETVEVTFQVESEDGFGDEMKLEFHEIEFSMSSHPFDSLACSRVGVHGEIGEYGSWLIDGEAAKTVRCGGHAEGEV